MPRTCTRRSQVLPKPPTGAIAPWDANSGFSEGVRSDERLSLAERVILKAIAHYIRRNRVGIPRQSTIAERTGYSERRVQDAVRGLKAKGWLVVWRYFTSYRAYAIRLPIVGPIVGTKEVLLEVSSKPCKPCDRPRSRPRPKTVKPMPDETIERCIERTLAECGIRYPKRPSPKQRQWAESVDNEHPETFRQQVQTSAEGLVERGVTTVTGEEFYTLLGWRKWWRKGGSAGAASALGASGPRYPQRPKSPGRVLQDKLQALTKEELVERFRSGAVGRGEL